MSRKTTIILALIISVALLATPATAGFFDFMFTGKSNNLVGLATTDGADGASQGGSGGYIEMPDPVVYDLCPSTRMLAVTPEEYSGREIAAVDQGNALCQAHFGRNWRWAEWHDDPTGVWAMKGNLVTGGFDQFVWIWINDQRSECFSTGNTFGLTFYLSRASDGCVNANCHYYEHMVGTPGYNLYNYTGDIKCNPYYGDTPCYKELPLLCIQDGTMVCSETDGGINYQVAGTMTYAGTTKPDACLDSNRLHEYYCDGGDPSDTVTTCPYGCYEGKCLSVWQGAELNNFRVEGGLYKFDAYEIYQEASIDGVKVAFDKGYMGGSVHTWYEMPCKEGRSLVMTAKNAISGQLTRTTKDISGYDCEGGERYCRQVGEHLEEGLLPAGQSLDTYRPFTRAYMEYGDSLSVLGGRYTVTFRGFHEQSHEVSIQVMNRASGVSNARMLGHGDHVVIEGLELFVEDVFVNTIGGLQSSVQLYYRESDDKDFKLIPSNVCADGKNVDRYACDPHDGIDLEDTDECDFRCEGGSCIEPSRYCSEIQEHIEIGTFYPYVVDTEGATPTAYFHLYLEQASPRTVRLSGEDFTVELLGGSIEENIIVRVTGDGTSTKSLDVGDERRMAGLLVYVDDVYVSTIGEESIAARLYVRNPDDAVEYDFEETYDKWMYENLPQRYCVGNDIYERSCVGSDGDRYTEELRGTCEHGCLNGECVVLAPEACTDTDGGIDPFVAGTVTDESGFPARDSCDSTDVLFERFCLPGSNLEHAVNVNCDNGCDDGACNQEPYCVVPDFDDGTYDYDPLYSGAGGFRTLQTRHLEPYTFDVDGRRYTLKVEGFEGVDHPNVIVIVESLADGHEEIKIFKEGEMRILAGLDVFVEDLFISTIGGGWDLMAKVHFRAHDYGQNNWLLFSACNGNAVEHWTCVDGRARKTAVGMCANSCRNGACVDDGYTCADTDGGIDAAEKGHVSYGGMVMEEDELYVADSDIADFPFFQLIVFPDESAFISLMGESAYVDAGDEVKIGYVKLRITDVHYDQLSYEDGSYVAYELLEMHDVCDEDGGLEEAYCSNNVFNSRSVDCQLGCFDGACLPLNDTFSCYDSDGGEDYYVPGRTSFAGNVASDMCLPSARLCPSAAGCGGGDWLVEWVCDSAGAYVDGASFEGMRPVFRYCGAGCKGGACLEDRFIPERTVFKAPIVNVEAAVLDEDGFKVALQNNLGAPITLTMGGWMSMDRSCGFFSMSGFVAETDEPLSNATVIGNGEVFVLEWGCDDFSPPFGYREQVEAELAFEYVNRDTGLIRSHSGEVLTRYAGDVPLPQPGPAPVPSQPEPDPVPAPGPVPSQPEPEPEPVPRDCDGCDVDGRCLRYGIRDGNSYCGLGGDMLDQKGTDALCENDYECRSNFCLDDRCVERGFFQKLLELFARWF